MDGLLPLVLLLGVSGFTRAPERTLVDRFYGKMKTPVAATPELDTVEVAVTWREPQRFDHLKLWPRSSWEFTRWNSP